MACYYLRIKFPSMKRKSTVLDAASRAESVQYG